MTTPEMIQLIIIDGVMAAVTAIGFAISSNPSRKAILISALLAAIGHGMRFLFIQSGMDISVSTFIVATLIGLLSIFFARIIHCPAEVFSFPSLLPMIPGLFAYRTILSLIKFMQNTNPFKNQEFIMDFFHNGMTTLFILLALVVGVSLPVLLFPKLSFSVTRRY